MNLFLFLVWLQMSAQPQTGLCPNDKGCLTISTIDNAQNFCAGSAYCFPLLIDPSAEGYGPLKGVPDKGKIACEIKQDHMRCINAFGDSVELKFNGARPPIVLNQFSEAAQRAADETDGKPRSGNGGDKYMGAFDGRDKPDDPVDVPAVQETREVDGGQDCNVCKDGSCTAMWCAPHKVKEQFDTCTDKSRVLLTSEDGKKHCLKF